MNNVLMRLRRPEKGWDPVSPSYAATYSDHEWSNLDVDTIDKLERWIGGFEKKRVLDLGAGPGQYSVAFALRGARVTWHDVSSRYLAIAREKALSHNVDIDFSLGYLEDARRFIDDPFDLVFNRICWYYCTNDRAFSELVYRLTKPGGAAYVDSAAFEYLDIRNWKQRLPHLWNKWFGIKFGHPHPPHGRIAGLLLGKAVDYMTVDYASHRNDRVFFVKSRALKERARDGREADHSD